ncbi:TPA: toprim domain-containing protein [Candidatus Woesearchaeota archaeon]|nr:toprim domain-containing protein [Candidatus Woesearchaeota archaeon]
MGDHEKTQNRTKNNRLVADELRQHLHNMGESHILIIVEGFKDKKALANVGIANVFALDRMPLYKVVETVAKKATDCMILTDLDAEGKKLYARLNHDLQRHGVRVDNSFREFLFRHTSLRQIEGLDSYFKKI